jgi:hypothetical protein
MSASLAYSWVVMGEKSIRPLLSQRAPGTKTGRASGEAAQTHCARDRAEREGDGQPDQTSSLRTVRDEEAGVTGQTIKLLQPC